MNRKVDSALDYGEECLGAGASQEGVYGQEFSVLFSITSRFFHRLIPLQRLLDMFSQPFYTLCR